MTDKAQKAAEEARLQQISDALHKWKENNVTKTVFSYLKQISNELTTNIIHNAQSSIPVDQKLYNYYASVAKLELITEILSIGKSNKDEVPYIDASVLEDLWEKQ